jgi:hypothetical protein
MIEFIEENEEGEEITHELPSKKQVCSKCHGEGTHLNPSIGEHAYSAEEFEREFDDEEREEYFTRGGMYDVQCIKCNGRNVEEVVDEERCDKELLKRYYAKLADDDEYEQMCRSEIEYGC